MANEFKLSYTAADINTRLGKIDNLAEKNEVPKKLSDLTNDLDFATKNWVEGKIEEHSDFVAQPEAPSDTSMLWLDTDDNSFDSGGNVDLTGYATEQWVQDQKYLTEVPDGYAKSEDIPTKPEDIGALPSTYTPPNQTAEQVGADPAGTAANAVSQHNTANNSHGDIRLELKAINERLTAFFDSDNQTLDELSEIVAYITSNKSLIDGITINKVNVADIIDNLTTNVTNKPLSAAQGVVLKGLIDAVSKSLSNYQPKGDYALKQDIVSDAVRYGTQTLTEVQKAQARANIGARSVVTPQDYGAKGNGSTDDTEAFQNALSANRVVFVPGGTYKLSGELVIRDNCHLELAQDVVMNFTKTSGNCITMNRSAFLKGNHATVNVPYAFTGRVINVDTTVHTSIKDVPPFTHWDPQWKTGRYLTDLNICKADSAGLHRSASGDSNGTAVYIYANGSATSTFIWGMNFSGLRIAGAFEYGLRAISTGYNHEMRFEAFMDAIKIGVSLEDCNNAYISATIQPRAAANGTVYAKHGIQLINSHNTDLTGSRVWDWNAKTSLWTYDKDNVHQHFAMYGNCYGTILNDFYYYAIPSGFTDIRELIYTDTPANYDSLIILQEPFTKWFKQVDNLPYFNNGVDGNQRLCLKSEQDALFHTKKVAQFTNQLPLATDANGAVYEGKGYSTGYLSPSNPPVKEESSAYKHTGFIPCKPKSVIRFSGIKWHSSTGYDRIFAYSDYNTLIIHINSEDIMSGISYFFDYAETEDGFIITLKDVGNFNDIKYFRINLRHEDVGTNPVITVDEEIVYAQMGFLDDGINMSHENVVGLNEHYVGINRRALKISSASTDEQYPTAKAVYDLVNGAFGEYITDIAALVGGDA